MLFFGLTLFLSAALSFLLQPMVARQLLPVLGGSPGVWSTCLVFFQGTLLAGYLLADRVVKLAPGRQVPAHLGLVALAALGLAAWLRPAPAPPAGDPTGWLLQRLALTAGPPFLVLCLTTPLLQSWFARLPQAAGRDPYVLYRASNLGSFAGLFSYPFLLEPALTVAAQQRVWVAGYALLALLLAACGLRARVSSPAPPVASRPPLAPASEGEGWWRRGRWVLLAFVPSSLTLGVTAYITADLAAVPLLWVIPLGLYLLSFTVAFGDRPLVTPRGAAPWLAVTLLLVVASYFAAIGTDWRLTLPLHLAFLALAAIVCHGRLSEDRPPAAQLTSFYVWLAVGGVLGGAFNALVAPRVFPGNLEYPIGIILVALLLPASGRGQARPTLWDAELALLAGSLVVIGGLVAKRVLTPGVPAMLLVFGLGGAVTLAALRRPWRFGLSVAAMIAGAALALPSTRGRVIHRDRTFFGTMKVLEVGEGRHELLHGSTLHGRQDIRPAARREPLAYYYRRGPVGQLFEAFRAVHPTASVGVVGLGTGTLAAYARPGDRWRFYEIDSGVVRIARDPRYFTYLTDAPAEVSLALGDARVSLAQEPDARFHLLVLDAFSSDAIPVHLLTREALALYRSRLAPGGVVVFNVSNRYLDLVPNLARIASELGLEGRHQDHRVTAAARGQGSTSSRWVVVGEPGNAVLAGLAATGRWPAIQAPSGGRAWTDDYSNLVSALDWGSGIAGSSN